MQSKYEGLLGNARTSATITRIIHQTYGTHKLPLPLQKNVEELKEKNPSWEHRLYDDEDIEVFIASQYGKEILNAYLRIDPTYGAARADLFRYLVIYKVGGVYLDIKSSFSCPIDEVIRFDNEFIASQWSNKKGEKYEGFGLKPEVSQYPGGELQQWHVIAAAGHPFLRAVILAVLDGIDAYRPWLHGTGKVGVLRLTGPVMYTLTIMPIIAQYPCRIIENEAAIGLNYSVVPGDTHKILFKSHYSTSKLSVVRLSGIARLINFVYQLSLSLQGKLSGVISAA
jgi:hypothetical protein